LTARPLRLAEKAGNEAVIVRRFVYFLAENATVAATLEARSRHTYCTMFTSISHLFSLLAFLVGGTSAATARPFLRPVLRTQHNAHLLHRLNYQQYQAHRYY